MCCVLGITVADFTLLQLSNSHPFHHQFLPARAGTEGNGTHAPLACLMFTRYCSVSSLALAQVLTSSQGERGWDLNQIKSNFIFFFPLWINFKSCLLFYPIHQVPAQMLLPARRRGQLRWGNEWLWAVQEKRERDIYFSGTAACAVLKLLWKYSKVTNCHHHVWMDHLHPAPLYL